MAQGITEVTPIADEATGRRVKTVCHEDQGIPRILDSSTLTFYRTVLCVPKLVSNTNAKNLIEKYLLKILVA